MQRRKRLSRRDGARWGAAVLVGLGVLLALAPARGAERAAAPDEMASTGQAAEQGEEGAAALGSPTADKAGYDPVSNIVAIHDSSSRLYRSSCGECHADVRSQHSQDPSIPAAHLAMFEFAAGREGSDSQCRWCHRTVDLTPGAAQPAEKSIGNLRRTTDVTLCTLCHGPDRGGAGRQFYQTGISPDNPDGPFLYDLACSPCHGPLETSEVRGESASEIQNKIDENEAGMGALSVLTPPEIAAIAAALAGGGDD